MIEIWPSADRVLVCGGRDFADWDLLCCTLIRLAPKTVIHGAARGADRMAGNWAARNYVAWVAVPAEWDKYGKAAGAIRNQLMLEMKPTMVLAFPGGRGTADMVKRSRAAGLYVMSV